MDSKLIKYFLLIFFISFKVSAVEFDGKFIQGHFIIGKTDPSSKVKIDKKQIKVSKESLKKSPRKKAVLSRADQLSGMLKLEDIIETSEGRYAFIDENMVKYFVQQGEWLDKVYVKRIDKNLVELKEIDGETIIILKLKH